MSAECTHPRAGVVRSDPVRFAEFAFAPVCERPECIAAAVLWVNRVTRSMGALYVADPLFGDGATPPATSNRVREHLVAAACATGVASTGAPSPLFVLPDPAACGHVMGSLVCTRDAHPFNPNGHVYAHPSWVADRHQGAS